MKKITLISTVLALSAMAFAESELSFSNKLYEENAIIAHDDEADEDIKDFPGIKDKVEFEYKSDKVDAAVTAIFSIDDFNDKNFGVTGKIDDWFVEFRPVSSIGLALHESIVADAATLPIYDDNLSSGNIGSDGFTFIYKPAALNDAFTIAFTAPFGWDDEDEVNSEKVNWFKKSGEVNEDGEESDDVKFNFGLGAIYSHELFQVGVSAQNLADSDNRVIGAYASLINLCGKVEGLNLNVGFANSKATVGFDDLLAFGGVVGENLLSAVVTYESDPCTVTLESLYNMGENETYDLYAALSVGFGLAEKLTATVTGKIAADTTDDNDDAKLENAFAGAFALDYELNENNSFGVEFDVDFCDGSYEIAVPVYWKYQL